MQEGGKRRCAWSVTMRIDPPFHGAKRLAIDAILQVRSPRSRLNEPCIAKDSEMLGNCRQAQLEPRGDVARVLRLPPQHVENLPPNRMG
jgi:hypothetical protein